jgi:NAD-dependent dihydropyrimidine dehydrogenase PreA subunit
VSDLHTTIWKRPRLSRYRLIVQLASLALFAFLVVLFVLFDRSLQAGEPTGIGHPAGVEALTPHLGYIELVYAVRTGHAAGIHPAALGFLLLALVLSLLVKKGFCSHLCPVGTLSEGLWWLGKKITRGREPRLPAFVDLPLRLAKYLLLGYFLIKVATLTLETLQQLAYSPAVKLSDLRILHFFAELPGWMWFVLGGSVVLSLFIPRFVCRYACPYGALLGVVSTASPLKIHRDESRCVVGCSDCAGVCPAWVNLKKPGAILHDECHLCLRCLDACPTPGALTLKLFKKPLPGWVVPIAVVGIVVLGLGLEFLSGGFEDGISREEYLARIGRIDEPLYAFRPGAPAVPAAATPYDGELFKPLRTYVGKPRKVLELLPMLDFEVGAAASGLAGGLETQLEREEASTRRTEPIVDTTLREEGAEEVPEAEEPEVGADVEAPPPDLPEPEPPGTGEQP